MPQSNQLLVERNPVSPLAPVRRNGYAAVVGRVAALITGLPPRFAGPPRTALISRVDERRLKDADVAQIGANGLAISTRRSREEWRAFLFDHFRRRYDLVLLFDSARTRVV